MSETSREIAPSVPVGKATCVVLLIKGGREQRWLVEGGVSADEWAGKVRASTHGHVTVHPLLRIGRAA